MTGIRWKIGEQILDVSSRRLIMGVLNITPDSFSDGGEYFTPESAINRGIQMVADGADIIDIGGESTRPGAESITAKEELRRVMPVIEKLSAEIDASHSVPNAAVERRKFFSIDTSKSEVAQAAITAGACIVNDVTGGRGDANMMPLVARTGVGFIIMHMQGTPKTMQTAPRYADVVSEVANYFLQQYDRAIECDIDPMAIAFDPGIGFGKTIAHNVELLRNVDRLRVHDRPIVVGVSRKAFLGKLIGSQHLGDRLAPTVAITALLSARGANVFRVHDVKENANALRVAEALLEKP